jgi:toxin-antitoxin system PIN domain toxin
MIAVDTNVLVYAHRKDSTWHKPAARCIIGLAEATTPWAIPWPCIHEFLAIVTHPRIFRPPTPLNRALADLETWFESPSLRLIGEPPAYWRHLRETLVRGAVAGPLVHDARIAAICEAHGIATLLSADRDFSRFPGLTVRNPVLPA